MLRDFDAKRNVFLNLYDLFHDYYGTISIEVDRWYSMDDRELYKRDLLIDDEYLTREIHLEGRFLMRLKTKINEMILFLFDLRVIVKLKR